MAPRSTGTSAPPATRVSRRPAALPPRYATDRSIPAKSVLSESTERLQPSERDMRRKRPPALSFLLRMATARRVARVLSLLALDFVGVALAIMTALILKAAVRGDVQWSEALH